MSKNDYNNPKNSLILFEIGNHLDFLFKLYNSNKFPKALMLTGSKGVGKSTLVNHFLNFVYNNKKYDSINKIIDANSSFHINYVQNTFPNIIYLSGDNYKNIKVEDIRKLKTNLLKTTILNKERFIILDDVELFNINSLNALLKIIEEPTDKNFFILINNKTRPLIETIYSRCIELKINLNNQMRIKSIETLINHNNLDVKIDYKNLHLSPGNFISFNEIINKHDINIEDNFIYNLEKILVLFKKNKNINLINLSLNLTELYFYNIKKKNLENIEKIIEKKSFVIENINKFFFYNLNLKSLINALSEKLSNE